MGSGDLGRLLDSARVAKAVCAVLALLVVTLLAPAPAAAQQQETALSRSQIVDPATLRKDADLDFGMIVPRTNSGTVVVTPEAAPTCTTTGGLVRTGPCKAAVFSGTAFYQADLRAMRPSGNSITLTGPGGASMQVNAFTFGSTGTTVYLGNNGANHRFTVNALDGSFTFYVGGTLQVGANQAPGLYNGTFDIRISYN